MLLPAAAQQSTAEHRRSQQSTAEHITAQQRTRQSTAKHSRAQQSTTEYNRTQQSSEAHDRVSEKTKPEKDNKRLHFRICQSTANEQHQAAEYNNTSRTAPAQHSTGT